MNLIEPKTSKRSNLQRKFVNQMRGMGDVPWPARRFHYPPTFANAVGALPVTELGTCKRPVGSVKMRRGKLRRKQDVEVRCGGRVFLRRGSLGKRRIVCVDCQARKRDRLKALRVQRQMQSRFGVSRRASVAEERRGSRLLSKFRRTGRA